LAELRDSTFPRWFVEYLPFLQCDGKEIPYEGPMMKRGQPVKSDYIHIDPGSFVSTKVDLSTVYNIPPSQACIVEFKGRIYDLHHPVT
jgi:hypothetical protein